MTASGFDDAFRLLTGFAPFPWQRALFRRLLSDPPANIPSACDLPTGLGKTSVIPVWLLALAAAPTRVPRRLVYVVNRRTVVDQSTREAEKVRANLGNVPDVDAALQGLCALKLGEDEPPLAISTLRGQFADNRAWSADPARPAVVVGTVDMVGSRLLFAGYGVGFKTRPLHAGFLAHDALLVHDEAHLEKPFQTLVTAIAREQERCRERKPLRVMALSATLRGAEDVFTLTPEEKSPPAELSEKPEEPIHFAWQRLRAKKGLDFSSAPRNGVAAKIADAALRHKESNAAVLVFVRTIDDVNSVRSALTKPRVGVPAAQVEVLTGTLRGLERDALATSNPVFARFLPTPLVPVQPGTVYLICTSAGEVGVDISAGHMVSDLTPLDSMAQRFGRVNRRGDGAAQIDVVYEADRDPKPRSPEFEAARWAALAELRKLPECAWFPGRQEASPLAIGGHIRGMSEAARLAAFTPPPTELPTSDVLFDAWALTTVRGRLPGRPPVEPYLHGVRDWEPPETHVAWREEVQKLTPDLAKTDDLRPFQKFAADLLDDFPLKPHELLRDRSDRVFKQLGAVAERAPDQPVWVYDEDDETVEVVALAALVWAKDGKDRIEGRTVLLPPAAGGLTVNGTLDGTEEHDDARTADYDVAGRLLAPDDKPYRFRIWADDAEFDRRTEGYRRVRKVVLPAGDDEDAEPREWHWFERPGGADGDWSRAATCPVAWQVHTDDVVKNTVAIAKQLGLPADEQAALEIAAECHDLGKRRPLFQRILGNPHPADPWAKSGSGTRGPRLDESFRHEFASVLDADTGGRLAELSPEMRDLALHLIGCHHGYARPHFPREYVFDPAASPATAAEVAAEVPRRFARLQRRYGRWGLAYLESVLRAADYAASAAPSAYVGGGT